jgi:hypothetical protein
MKATWSLVLVALLLAGSAQARSVKIADLIASLKKREAIVRVQEEKLSPPPPERSAERKYLVWAKSEDDEVFQYVLFFAAPKGKRYLNVLSVRFEGSPSFSRALYGFGYLVGFIEGACLGLSQETSQNLANWFGDRVQRIQENGVGQFNRNFGPVTVDLVGYHVGDVGDLMLVFTRHGAPGEKWPYWCEW